MSILAYLLLSVALFAVMIAVQAVFGIMQHGLVPLAGARDNLSPPNVKLDRAKRANANMIEAMVMFVPLAMIAIHTGSSGTSVSLGAAIFFWGRLAYAPLYWFGVPWLRTAAWGVSLAGLVIIFIQLMNFI